jgi:hypothetical protein
MVARSAGPCTHLGHTRLFAARSTYPSAVGRGSCCRGRRSRGRGCKSRGAGSCHPACSQSGALARVKGAARAWVWGGEKTGVHAPLNQGGHSAAPNPCMHHPHGATSAPPGARPAKSRPGWLARAAPLPHMPRGAAHRPRARPARQRARGRRAASHRGAGCCAGAEAMSECGVVEERVRRSGWESVGWRRGGCRGQGGRVGGGGGKGERSGWESVGRWSVGRGIAALFEPFGLLPSLLASLPQQHNSPVRPNLHPPPPPPHHPGPCHSLAHLTLATSCHSLLSQHSRSQPHTTPRYLGVRRSA